MNNTTISIVIPSYNEENRILSSLNNIQRYMDKHFPDYEIIVVDDGSTDNTIGVVTESMKKNPKLRLIRNKVNKGKGYSVKNGFLNSKGHYLLFSDADLSTPIGEIEKLMDFIDNHYDVAIGSRGLKESDIKIHQPIHRETMGKIFNLFVRALTIKEFKDTQCGFKLFKRKAALAICKRQQIERFSFDVEMLYIAKKLGYKIKEVPIQWFNSPNSRVNPIKDSMKMFIDLLKIRFNDLIGKYKMHLLLSNLESNNEVE